MPDPQLTVAYLINQYPKVSHTFIRREIHALEALGVKVVRFSIRSPRSGDLIDNYDQVESGKTSVILASGMSRWLTALGDLIRQPRRMMTALRVAISMGRRSPRGMLVHLVYLFEAAWLCRALVACGADHLHSHFGTNPAAVAVLTRMLGGPSVSFTVHGPEEFDSPIALSLGLKVKLADVVVAISSFGRSQLFRWADPFDWPKIEIVRCGLERDLLERPVSEVPSAPRFVCVGRLSEQKGHLVLLEALQQVRSLVPDIQLILVGDGPMRADIEAAIVQFGLQSAVTITGYADNARVIDEIDRARALILPSFAEGLPIVLMEAMACGRPTIATYVAGIPELVHHGDNGWLVPAASVKDLADAMLACVQASSSDLTQMGKRAATTVAELHSADAEAKKLRDLFFATTGRARHSGKQGTESRAS